MSAGITQGQNRGGARGHPARSNANAPRRHQRAQNVRRILVAVLCARQAHRVVKLQLRGGVEARGGAPLLRGKNGARGG